MVWNLRTCPLTLGLAASDTNMNTPASLTSEDELIMSVIVWEVDILDQFTLRCTDVNVCTQHVLKPEA